MVLRSIRPASICRKVLRASLILAGVGAVVLTAAAPYGAAAKTADIAQAASARSASVDATDVGGARRRDHGRRRSRSPDANDAFGRATAGSSVARGGFGYGVGDNSHNQTW